MQSFPGVSICHFGACALAAEASRGEAAQKAADLGYTASKAKGGQARAWKAAALAEGQRVFAALQNGSAALSGAVVPGAISYSLSHR